MLIIDDRYQVNENVVLGKGSFGEVFEVTDRQQDRTLAIKFESRASNPPRQLYYESKIYELFEEHRNSSVPACYGFGRITKNNVPHHYLLLEKVGQSFQDLDRISEVQACVLGMLAYRALKSIWACGICHRDIKPGNLCFSRSDPNKIVLIDFGLAKKYKHDDGSTIPMRKGKGMTGTPRYSSLRVSGGYEQAPRDDFEGLLNVLVWMIKGRLPWQGLEASQKSTKHRLIYEKKAKTPLAELLSGMDTKWISLFEYARNIPYESLPSQAELHFRRILMRLKPNAEKTS
jgi:casein kinase 1